MRRVVTILFAILIGFSMYACKSGEDTKKSKTVDEILEIAKQNLDTSRMVESDKEMLNALMQIEVADYDEMKYMAPATNLNTNQILVIKSKDNDKISKKLDEFIKTQIELYSSYLPEEAEKLKSGKKFLIDDKVVLIVGENASEVDKAKAEIEK